MTPGLVDLDRPVLVQLGLGRLGSDALLVKFGPFVFDGRDQATDPPRRHVVLRSLDQVRELTCMPQILCRQERCIERAHGVTSRPST
jgi:hypothetical protein